jgi:hypothetical protein
MEFKGSLPYSQQPILLPYSEPDESSLQTPWNFLKAHINNIVSFRINDSVIISFTFHVPHIHRSSNHP